VVNGKIWPKMEVEPRNYRLRLLNGCDSRFLIVQFVRVELVEKEIPEGANTIPFRVIGSDGGFAWNNRKIDTLVIEPAGRYDLVFNFGRWEGYRIVMRNIGLDEPFGGYFDPVPPVKTGTTYLHTDRIMAFDVVLPLNRNIPDNFDPSLITSMTPMWLQDREIEHIRQVGLFEGSDAFGRILPLQGTVVPATDVNGNPMFWPNTRMYKEAGLAGLPMEGTAAWHSPITENIKLDSVEEWEIWNFSEDAHPIHLHLVFFQILGRNAIVWDSATTEENRVLDDPELANGDGTYLVEQPVVMHDGSIGKGLRVVNPTKGEAIPRPPGYFEFAPKNVAVSPPNEITRIKAHFDKAGEYNWHCHILSHEDHSMMRPFLVHDSNEVVVIKT
jgi:spore coat protein A, manganese oxidase